MTLPRVRFAPSPTGYLHIGGARTALFNWLFARRARGEGKGTFVLRIEDTDRERSTEASVQAILDGMRWMGLDWDEGPEVLMDGRKIGGGPNAPYYQTQRLATYDTYAERLIAERKAYRCDCKKADLDVLREQAQKEKRGFKYPGICREKNLPKGTPGAIVRFRMPDEGAVAFDDLVKGTITTQCSEMQDEVILRADGMPLYNFGAVVDDVEMAITLVARGDDHVVNTPRQILMYQALGFPVPTFAHLPMILGADKQRLSKRHGAVSVLQYRDEGYLPGALVNYLVRLGWSHGDQEIFTLDELVEKFDWDHVGDTAGVFNPEKLLWLNQQWIKKTPPAELAAQVKPLMISRHGDKLTGEIDVARLALVLAPLIERAKTLLELADKALTFFQQGVTFDEAAVKKHLTAEAKAVLESARTLIDTRIGEGGPAMEAAFRDAATAQGLGLGKLAQPVRVAVTGTAVSPPLFDIIVLLGRESRSRGSTRPSPGSELSVTISNALKNGARRAFLIAAFLVGAMPIQPAQAAGEFKSHGFILPGGAVRIDDDRYRLPMGWDDVQRFYRNTYPAARYTRKTLRNQTGVRALHIDNPKADDWTGINMYEAARGEVRIYVLSKGGPAARTRTQSSSGLEATASAETPRPLRIAEVGRPFVLVGFEHRAACEAAFPPTFFLCASPRPLRLCAGSCSCFF